MKIEVSITSYDDSTQIVLYCHECRLPFKMFSDSALLTDIQEAENDHYLEHLIKMQEVAR